MATAGCMAMTKATTTAMTTEAAHVLFAWFSPGYPSGGFAYSHGLEQEIAAARVRDAGDLRRWIAAVLRHGAGRNDAILLCAAWRAGPEGLEDLSDLAMALAGAAERSRETFEQGRAFAAVTADAYGTDARARPYPVAVGAAAAAIGLPLEATVRHYLHGFVANLVSAAVRFLPLGQTEGQRVLRALFEVIDAVAEEAVTADVDALGSAVPGADLAAIEHEMLPVRIFRS